MLGAAWDDSIEIRPGFKAESILRTNVPKRPTNLWTGRRKTHPVKQKKPNALGLYDMSGNVGVWVSDFYDKGYYKNSPKDNPKRPTSGKYRMLRGGFWGVSAGGTRASFRGRDDPDVRSCDYGFRVVRTN